METANTISETTALQSRKKVNAVCFVGFYVFLITVSTLLKICRNRLECPQTLNSKPVKFEKEIPVPASSVEIKTRKPTKPIRKSAKDVVLSHYYDDAEFKIVKRGEKMLNVVKSKVGVIGVGANAPAAWKNAFINCRKGNVPISEPWTVS